VKAVSPRTGWRPGDGRQRLDSRDDRVLHRKRRAARFHLHPSLRGDVGLSRRERLSGHGALARSRAIYREIRRSRGQIAASARPDLELHYTEWSASYTPSDPIHDSYHSAAFILDKIKGTGSARSRCPTGRLPTFSRKRAARDAVSRRLWPDQLPGNQQTRIFRLPVSPTGWERPSWFRAIRPHGSAPTVRRRAGAVLGLHDHPSGTVGNQPGVLPRDLPAAARGQRHCG